jgi:hypothetical protein
MTLLRTGTPGDCIKNEVTSRESLRRWRQAKPFRQSLQGWTTNPRDACTKRRRERGRASGAITLAENFRGHPLRLVPHPTDAWPRPRRRTRPATRTGFASSRRSEGGGVAARSGRGAKQRAARGTGSRSKEFRRRVGRSSRSSTRSERGGRPRSDSSEEGGRALTMAAGAAVATRPS